jgi:hypothetical protein
VGLELILHVAKVWNVDILNNKQKPLDTTKPYALLTLQSNVFQIPTPKYTPKLILIDFKILKI